MIISAKTIEAETLLTTTRFSRRMWPRQRFTASNPEIAQQTRTSYLGQSGNQCQASVASIFELLPFRERFVHSRLLFPLGTRDLVLVTTVLKKYAENAGCILIQQNNKLV